MSSTVVTSVTYKPQVPLMTIAFRTNGTNASRDIEARAKDGFVFKSAIILNGNNPTEYQEVLIVMEKFN